MADLYALCTRFIVQAAVIDERPGTRLAHAFVLGHDHVLLARYDRQEPVHEREGGSPTIYHLNRTDALDQMYARFRGGMIGLPRDARTLGGRVRDGLGEYYRELRALHRTLERDAQGNWTSRWIDGGRADQYAHAEVCALFAERCGPAPAVPLPIGITKRSLWRSSGQW